MRLAVPVAGLLLLAGCLDHDLAMSAETASSFIALQRDFGPYQGWASYDLGESTLEGHPPGHRTLYVNRLPEPGASSFPVGTMLLKTAESGAVGEWLVHAMVKRGGGYNQRGASGWEWFELKLTEARQPVIVWRGEAPPNGERYGCLQSSCDDAPDCNQCHAQAAANDYVQTPALRLGDL